MEKTNYKYRRKTKKDEGKPSSFNRNINKSTNYLRTTFRTPMTRPSPTNLIR